MQDPHDAYPDPHDAFEKNFAPVFCDFIRNNFAPKLGHLVTSSILFRKR